MTMTSNNFRKSGVELISCHNPLVLLVDVTNVSATMDTGDVTAALQGQAPTVNTTAYTFDMIYLSTVDNGGGSYTHSFRLDVTKAVREICNEGQLVEEAVSYQGDSDLGSKIQITIASTGETSIVFTNTYMHGFNQIGDGSGSALVDFADETKEIKIPISPGIPMIHYIYSPGDATSVIHYIELKLNKTTTSDTVQITAVAPLPVSLYMCQDATWNDDLVSESEIIREHELRISETNTSSTIQTITLVSLKKACSDSIVLAWLNRYGTYSYLALDAFRTERNEQKYIGSYDKSIDDLDDVRTRHIHRGYMDVKKILNGKLHNIPIEYMEIVEDLFYSKLVYKYIGTIVESGSVSAFDDADWIQVKVSGQPRIRTKQANFDLNVEVELPEYYTQRR